MARCPALLSCWARRRARCFVRMKTMADSQSLRLSMCSSRARLRRSATRYSAWSMVAAGALSSSSTTCGSLNRSSASRRISLGMVAANIRFCRRGGSALRILRMSGRKPMSNMWSASSSTRVSIWKRRSTPCWSKSRTRPGQPTMISGCARSALSWLPIETPP